MQSDLLKEMRGVRDEIIADFKRTFRSVLEVDETERISANRRELDVKWDSLVQTLGSAAVATMQQGEAIGNTVRCQAQIETPGRRKSDRTDSRVRCSATA